MIKRVLHPQMLAVLFLAFQSMSTQVDGLIRYTLLLFLTVSRFAATTATSSSKSSALCPSRMLIGLIGYFVLLWKHPWWFLTDPNCSVAISRLWSVSIHGILIWQLILKKCGWSVQIWLHTLPIIVPTRHIRHVQYKVECSRPLASKSSKCWLVLLQCL